MNDFFDDLKAIKKDMVKENDKKEEFDLAKESVKAREKRLQDDFLEYMRISDIKKI